MPASQRIRVMVVDDHSILRVGLKQVVESSGEFEVVGQAADGAEAVRVAAAVSPDIVVMDVTMPGMDGVEACREIMASAPDTRVLMLTASTEEAAVVESVAAGATGYLQKETDRERLLLALRGAMRGELRVTAPVFEKRSRRLAARRAPAMQRATPGSPLGSARFSLLLSRACRMPQSRRRGESSPSPFGTAYTASSASWGSSQCRASCSGQCGTDSWTTLALRTSRDCHARPGSPKASR